MSEMFKHEAQEFKEIYKVGLLGLHTHTHTWKPSSIRSLSSFTFLGSEKFQVKGSVLSVAVLPPDTLGR